MLSQSPAADDQFVWNLLSEAPTPIQGSNIIRSHIERVLANCRIRKLTADEVLSTLKATPLVLSPGAGEAAADTSYSCFRRSRCSINSWEM